MQTLPSEVQQRRPSAWLLSALIALVICACSLFAVSRASAAGFTWSGDGYPTTTWSDGANWLGGVAPSNGEPIETLTLPKLTSGGSSDNNVTGLSVNHLAVEGTYAIKGEGLSLGSGGLTVGGPESVSFLTSMPLSLSASQTWTVSGPSGGQQTLELSGPLAGESSELTIDLNTPTFFFFQDSLKRLGGGNPDDEVGNVTINGADDSEVVLPSRFNATDGKRLTVSDIVLYSNGETATGPITANHSTVDLSGTSLGPITSMGSHVSLNGNVASLSLDESSSLGFLIHAPGNSLAEDNQFSSGGAVDLGNSELKLESYENEAKRCLPPSVGQVYTLISTTGSLSGAFGNVANGGTVVAECVGTAEGPPIVERVYPFRITYNTGGSTKTVTATALPAVPTAYEELPTISGTATQEQTLTESHAAWSNKPTSYTYQWQRCDSSGNNCQAISGATAQTYTLTAADVGSTMRVQETASDSEGTSAPQVSAATAVVQSAPAGGGSSTGGSTTSGGSSTGSSGSTGSGSGSGTTVTVSKAQIAALLGQQLIPSGKAAKIGALLKAGGLTMPFKALEAGTFTVGWYEVPAGAKMAKHITAKPVLVASGQMTFTGAGTGKIKVRLTAEGQKLLKHAKRFRLTAKGMFNTHTKEAVATTKTFTLLR
jgi:hypothetical protein